MISDKYYVEFEASNDIADSNNKEKKEARVIIEGISFTCIDKNSKSKTLVKKDLVRLDLQGLFNDKKGIRYANLQIQLNKKILNTQGGEEEEEVEEDVEEVEGAIWKRKSTTIAIVLMPCNEEIPLNIMKEAFNGSLNGRKKATIKKK